MAQEAQSQPLPPTLLYPLLKALGPEKLAKGRVKASNGDKVDPRLKREFEATVDAALRAKTAKQFAALTNGADRVETGGSITKLTVEYKKDGYTYITVVYDNPPRSFLVSYPTT